MNKIGFIGCGNMGKAMVGGIIKSKLISPEQIIVSDLSEKALSSIKSELNVNITTDSIEVAKNSEVVVLAIKPNIYEIVMNAIKDSISKDTIVVTIAAGISLDFSQRILGEDIKIIRTMPNTPALVGEGMSAVCPNKNVTEEEINYILSLFSSFGKAELLPEYLINSVIGVSGSSPAYIFMLIEAMADAAVLDGMPRTKAYTFAAQAVLGSAKMVLETGKHPGELKDMVCSPGGTTIEAVKTLERTGFRSSVIDSIGDCIKKAKEMSK